MLPVLTNIDFFTVEVLTLFGIIGYHVLFAIRLETREVQAVGIPAQPGEEWMRRMARNLTDPFGGSLNDAEYLIMDRDPLYTNCFRNMLKDCGTQAGAITFEKSRPERVRRALCVVNQD